jgi:hypothetical protein
VIITKLNIKSKGLLPLFFLLVFWGCKKETTDIGVDILGDGNLNSIEVLITDISARSVRDDSSRTDNLSSNTLGVVNDPIFGLSKSCLIVQPRLTQFGTDDTPKSIDSVKLILKYDYEQNVLGNNNILKYGDINSVLVMDIYKLNEDLVDTVKYYSTFKPELGDIVGTFTGSFNFSDSTSLEIMLNNSFGQEMLDWNSDIYKDEAKFLKTLKGLVIVPRNNTLSGEGAIVCVEAGVNSSKLQLFYNDSLTKTIPMGSSSRRINYYETQPSVNLTNQFNSTNNFRTTYAQSFGGAKIKVDLVGLDSVIKLGEKVVINEAKITFLLDQISITDEFKAPSRMFLVVPDTLNSKYSMPIIDLTTTSNYGGDFNPVIKGYEFHFNRYLQQLVKEYAKTGKNNFNGFYLSIPSDYPVTPYRGVFKTDKDAGDIKVSITFTKLD